MNPERLASVLADRHRIQRELDAGGMATVYLAEDLKHHRMVAIKVLKPELAAALGADRFLSEIETTSSLRHPHILPLYDSGRTTGPQGGTDDLLYYVMPFVEGESLRDRLNRERELPIEDAPAIAREVADALGYAHARGVVHRDIKPENILLEGRHAVVADFGIARAISVAGGERLSQTGMAIVLTVVDQWSRQRPLREPTLTIGGLDVATAWDRAIGLGAVPRSITLDHGTELLSQAIEDWAYQPGIQLDFIRPGEPVENAHIVSFLKSIK